MKKSVKRVLSKTNMILFLALLSLTAYCTYASPARSILVQRKKNYGYKTMTPTLYPL